jgi:hypothetical protein
VEQIIYPLPGEIYKHYKGGTYEVITMATNTETQEAMVIYKSLNFGSIYARTLDIWNSKVFVEHKHGVSFETNRFEKKSQ